MLAKVVDPWSNVCPKNKCDTSFQRLSSSRFISSIKFNFEFVFAFSGEKSPTVCPNKTKSVGIQAGTVGSDKYIHSSEAWL